MKILSAPKSIFGKLIVSFLIVIIITLVSVGGMLSYLMEKYFYGMREWQVKQQAETMASLLYDSLDENNMEQLSEIITPLAQSLDMKIRVLDADGKVVASAFPRGWDNSRVEGFDFERQEIEQVYKGNALTKKAFGPGAKRLLLAMPLPFPEMAEDFESPQEIIGIITLDSPLKGIEDTVTHLSKLILYSGAAAILISGFIAFSLSQKIAGPLRAMNRSAREIAEGNFKSRIEVKPDDEIGQIANTFNYAAAEIEKTVAEQKKLAVLRKNLLDNVSHDFRTPLSAIRGYSELMLDGLLPPQDHNKYLGLILDNTKHLGRLLQDLMELSSIEGGHLVLRSEYLDVHNTAKRSLNNILTQAESKDLQVHLQVSEQTPQIYADQDRMNQILINLLENAVQYTPAGGRVWLKSYPSSEKDMVVFEVGDTGIGISKEEQDRIWERFYKVDKARGNAKRSSGLGLAITKQLVELQGGITEVESSLGQGSIFKVSMPTQPI